MANPEPEMITTADFLRKMDEVQKQLDEQAKDRHRVNGVVHATVNQLVLQTNAQDNVLGEIKRAVARIEEVLVGNERFHKVGIIETVTGLEARMALVEQSVATKSKIFTAVVAVLAALGAFIAWVKDLGIFKP